MEIEIKDVAEALKTDHPLDIEWLGRLPCHPNRPIPISFYTYNLTTVRRRYGVVGPVELQLNKRGKSVRDLILSREI